MENTPGVEAIETLVREGDYRSAAHLCTELELFGRARQLYEMLFDYNEAGSMALAQGDDAGAIDLFLKGNSLQRAEEVRRRLMSELSEDLPQVLDLFEAGGFFLQAAELAESIGKLEKAASLYLQASTYQKAAGLLERLGRFKEAGEAHEVVLRGDAENYVSNLGLGRVLQRFGRHREAIPLLVRGLKDTATVEESGRRVAYSFFKLRLLEAGRAALERAKLPRTIDLERFMRPFEMELQGQEQAQKLNTEGEETLEGRYRLEKSLGGRISATYMGSDLLSNRKVIIRFFPGDHEDNLAFFDELERIQHARCRGHARVLEINREAGFVASEFVEGDTLRRVLTSSGEPLSVLQCRGIAIQLFDAVKEAHKVGALHGALSTTCIRLMPGGACVVDDWGLRLVEKHMATQTGGPESSFAYRAPEINLGRIADFRADLYAVAAILYRCIQGDAPRLGRGGEGWDEWPEAFAAFFAKAMAPSPGDRYGSHAEFRRALASLPWDRAARFEIRSTVLREKQEEETQGPRFCAQVEPDVGECVDAEDTLLKRSVRLIRLLPRRERPVHFVNRLHAFAGPEQPILQDVLCLDDASDVMILEKIHAPSVSDWMAGGGRVATGVVLEAAEALLRAVEQVHKCALGLGTLGGDSLFFDGRVFRVPVEKALLHEEAALSRCIEMDAVDFWKSLGALLGIKEDDVQPGGIVMLLWRRKFLSEGDAKHLLGVLPQVQGSLVGWSTWFAELKRCVEAQDVRRDIWERLRFTISQEESNQEELMAHLHERKKVWGL